MFLPVAHPELNPIEMVWSFVKRSVAFRNLNYYLLEVENETRRQVAKVIQSEFATYLGHSMKKEDRYRKLSANWGELTETDSDIESQHKGNIIWKCMIRMTLYRKDLLIVISKDVFKKPEIPQLS